MDSPVNEVIRTGKVKLRVIFQEDEEGGFVAECVDIPGCLSQGETLSEAKVNIGLAINACLEVMFEDYFATRGNSTSSFQETEGSIWESMSVSVPHLIPAFT